MKKTILLLLLTVLMLSLFVACGEKVPTNEILNPTTAPPPPAYVPAPLGVEFFSTNYSNMSPWKAYPEVTTEAPDADTTPEASE